MDIETKLKWLNFNSWYGLYPRRKSMSEEYYNESFVKTVENTANTAIAAGRDVNEVIHDAIEVIYGRKNINELLPSGWIVVLHDCSGCAYYQSPGLKPCYRCYNRLFDDLYEGPYTDNFKSKEEKEQKSFGNDPLRDCENCVYDSLRVDNDVSPCYSCIDKSEKPNFTPLKGSAPIDRKKENDPEEQKHVEVEEGKYCYNCKYEELKTEELPCHNCYWDAARPSFTPKEEE